MADLNSLKNYFIALGIIAAACVIAMIACAKRPKPEKFLVRAHGGMLILVSLILVVNIICTGPMYTLLSLASGQYLLRRPDEQRQVLLRHRAHRVLPSRRRAHRPAQGSDRHG